MTTTKQLMRTFEQALTENGCTSFYAADQELVGELCEIIGRLHRLAEYFELSPADVARWVENDGYQPGDHDRPAAMRDKPRQVPASIVTMCNMFGIQPPRLLTRADIDRLYRGMPLVAAGVWANVEKTQSEQDEP